MLFPEARFRILTHWHLSGTPEQIAALLTHPEEFPRWWGDGAGRGGAQLGVIGVNVGETGWA